MKTSRGSVLKEINASQNQHLQMSHKNKIGFFFASGPILLYSFDMDQYGHHFHGITSNDIINLSTNEVCFFIIYFILLVGVYLYTWTWSLNDKIEKPGDLSQHSHMHQFIRTAIRNVLLAMRADELWIKKYI